MVRGREIVRDIEIDFFAAAEGLDAAVHERDAQGEDVAARGSVAETARAAGIGGDVAADGGGVFGGIGGVELAGVGGGGLHFAEQHAGADHCPALAYF